MLRLLLRGSSAVVSNGDMSSSRCKHRFALTRAQSTPETLVHSLSQDTPIRATSNVAVLVLLALLIAMSSPVWAVSDPLARLRFTGSQSLPIKVASYETPTQAIVQPSAAPVELPSTLAAPTTQVRAQRKSRRRKARGAKRKSSAPVSAAKAAPVTAKADVASPSLLGLFPTSKAPRWAREVFRSN